MGKVLKFEKKIKPKIELTPEESQADEVAKSIREMFDDHMIEQIRKDLEDES